MAKANPVNLNPQPVEADPSAPTINYYGEDAKKVTFAINPLAKIYDVYSNGIIVETLK